jgi:KDO2-lipid IV(A) lauroyltransferase
VRVKVALASRISDVAAHAPRGLAGPLSVVLGGLLMIGYGRRTTLENLRRVFPRWSRLRRWRTAFASYRRMGRVLVEFLHTASYTDEEIRDRVALSNLEALREAHREDHGVILVSGHFGNWEWLGRRLVAEGYPFAALYKEPKDPAFGERVRATREAAGVKAFDHDDVRAALRWLRRGGVLGIIMDQEPRTEADGVMAPLFGRPARTYAGPFRLARMTDAPVITVFCLRAGRGRYRARFEPLDLSDTKDPEEALVEDATAFNERLEAVVLDRPDYWLWMYERWKRVERQERLRESA